MFKFCPFCGSKVEEQTNVGFKCQECQKKYYYGSVPTASVVPIFKDKVLLAVRGIEPAKGQLDLIGGFLENGEDPLDGALREMEEETGHKINLSDLKFLGIWLGKYKYQGDIFNTFNVVYTIDFDSELKLEAKDDVESLKWTALADEYEFAFSPIHKILKKINSSRT